MEKAYKKLYKRLKEGANYDPANAERLCLKTTEELGELVEAINWYVGYKNTDKSKKEIEYALAEEISDVIICATAVGHKIGLDPDFINEVFEKKIKKWIDKFKNQK
jgi:NTP pyrophosphatase (non-canonical NTP hydrolase)